MDKSTYTLGATEFDIPPDGVIFVAKPHLSLEVRSQAVRQIIAPYVTDIRCGGCRNLDEVIAPNAVQIVVTQCWRLKSFQVQEARSIFADGCHQLETLVALKATEIFVTDCRLLRLLYAPSATSINCDYCEKLQTIESRQLFEISLDDCFALRPEGINPEVYAICGGMKSTKLGDVLARFADIKGRREQALEQIASDARWGEG